VAFAEAICGAVAALLHLPKSERRLVPAFTDQLELGFHSQGSA
jgi:hypothetical protein